MTIPPSASTADNAFWQVPYAVANDCECMNTTGDIIPHSIVCCSQKYN